MKKTILSIIMLSMILTSCKDNNTSDKITKEQDSPSQIHAKENNEKPKTTNTTDKTSKTNISKNHFESSILDFQSCKSINEKRLDCRNQISKFIGEVYHINDFKDKNNNYIIFDSIQPIIKRSKSWKNLGTVTNQEHINQAVKHVNNGGLALAIDTSQSYGHVAIIQSGSTQNSRSWNMKLPNVFSLSNYKPSASFYNKSLAYAFKKSDDLQIYIRQ